MSRFFNTLGPCRPDWHYMLPAVARLPELPQLVERQGYFLVHGPRQIGKTSVLWGLAEQLTASGAYAALILSCESARAVGEDYVAAQDALLSAIRHRAESKLPIELRPPKWPDGSKETPLSTGLAAWARSSPLPVVLFLDEIDALVGESLITVLSQLRTGHQERPDSFPASVVLCGLRDVRLGGGSGNGGIGTAKAASGGDASRLSSSSPFNVLVESFRLGDFSIDEVMALYGQHTAETGQEFTDTGVEYAYELTRGQPWLVNALANEVIVKMGVPVEEAIGPRRLETAKERLIQQRATHLDSLAAKLNEPRVRSVIEPVITGDLALGDDAYNDDLSYLCDLGLVARQKPIQIANPIYREVILRVLGSRVEANVTADPRSFVLEDGRLDFERLLSEFAAFWKQHGEVLAERDAYHEAAPHLVSMAFLHRIVNGGGYIDREYGIGRGRIDLHVRWPYENAVGKRVWQHEAMELKVWRDGRHDPLPEGLEQLDSYLDRIEVDHGALVVFDRRGTAPSLPERVAFDEAATPSGRPVRVLRA